MNKIPTVIQTYDEWDGEPRIEKHGNIYRYEVADGEIVLVHLWVRYPSYDFIFGVPATSNPKYKKEFGFFQFRKMKDGKAMSGWSIYVDQAELEEMAIGFRKMLEISRAMREEEWGQYDATKRL